MKHNINILVLKFITGFFAGSGLAGFMLADNVGCTTVAKTIIITRSFIMLHRVYRISRFNRVNFNAVKARAQIRTRPEQVSFFTQQVLHTEARFMYARLYTSVFHSLRTVSTERLHLPASCTFQLAPAH